MHSIKSKLTRAQAQKHLSKTLSNSTTSTVSFPRHARDRMKKRNLTARDIYGVLEGGKIYNNPQYRKGSWRYKVKRRKITAVIAFIDQYRIRIVTVWRKLMSCLLCGHKMKKSKNGPYEFTESGLSNIYLQGVEEYICTNVDCGENEVSIPNLGGLLELIAQTVARKREKLLPEEIRFLRSHLGFSSSDFAERIGVSPKTVSRWERGGTDMKETTEKFLRVLILSKAGPFRNYDELQEFAKTKKKSAKGTKFTYRRPSWQVSEAA